MIRYPIGEDELWGRINALQPNWKSRSETRTANFVRAGRYNESSGIWSEIKDVYIELQHAKCGYCEKWLEGGDYGAIEHDVEHYRPKGRIRAYPSEFTFSTGDTWDVGYFRLAYQPLNYLTTCKTCNSRLKSDYFPIAATRIDGADHPRDLTGEAPFLLYPISDIDNDPEDLIGFDGITAIPVGESLALRRRAQVTIEFFQLNNRDDLRRQRSNVIHGLYVALNGLQTNSNPEWKRDATNMVNRQLSSNASHANCSRCFVRLFFQSDAQRATRLAHEAAELQSP